MGRTSDIIRLVDKKIVEILGWYGVVAILLAYFLVSFDFISSGSALYQLLNLTGALGIFAISLSKKVYQTVVTNTFWAIIALVALLKLFL